MTLTRGGGGESLGRGGGNRRAQALSLEGAGLGGAGLEPTAGHGGKFDALELDEPVLYFEGATIRARTESNAALELDMPEPALETDTPEHDEPTLGHGSEGTALTHGGGGGRAG